MKNGTKTYYILLYDQAGLKAKDTNADIFSYDARQLDEQMETFFSEQEKVENGPDLKSDTLLVVLNHRTCQPSTQCRPSGQQ